MAGNRSNNSNHPRKMRVKKEPFSYKKLDASKKKLVKIAAIAGAVLIVVLIALGALDLLPHFTGSLHQVAGKLIGVTETDIVVNKGTSSSKQYFKLGSIALPEGYENDETYNIKSDDNETEWCLRPVDDASKFDFVMVCGCNKTWEEMIATVLAGGYATAETDVSAQIDGVSPEKGNEYHGCITTYLEPDSENNEYFKYYTAYIPSKKNTSVMVYINSRAKTAQALPTDEEMQALMAQMTDIVTID